MRRVSIAEDSDVPLPCPSCGYDLRATSADRCPECGGAIDEDVRSGEATIPWQHCTRLGRMRAFFATVVWALVFPSRLAKQAGRRVEHRAARHFQIVCCVIGAAALAIVVTPELLSFRSRLLGLEPIGWQRPVEMPSRWAVAGDWAIFVALWIALFVWLLLGSGAPSYFFHPRWLPRRLQDRAIALSYYAAAPLVLLAIVVFAWWSANTILLLSFYGGQHTIVHAVAWGACGVLALWCVMWTWWLPAHLLMSGVQASATRATAMLVTTAIAWPLLLVLTLVLIPGLVFYLQFLFLLLR